MKNKKLFYVLLFFIFITAIFLRVNSPESDLPDDITFSGSILTDEGNQCHNSRSKYLYDDWYPDDWKITYYNPILPYFKLAIFKVFGVGLWQIRLVSYIFSLLSLLFFFLTLKLYLNKKYALYGTALMGVNFLLLMFSKIGTFETPMIFWMILSLYFIEKYSSSDKEKFLVFAGMSAFMAFVFKNIAIYFIPVPIIALIMYLIIKNNKLKFNKTILPIIYILFGVGSMFIVWYFFFYNPNKEWINSAPGKYMKGLMSPKSFSDLLKNFITFPWKEQFNKIVFVWVGSLFFIPVFYRELFKKKVKLIEISYFLYFMAHTVLFLFLSYRPTRYLIPVIPAMIFMSVSFVYKIINIKNEVVEDNLIKRIVIYILDNIWWFFVLFFCFLPLFSHYIIKAKMSFLFIFLNIALLSIFHFLIKFNLNKFLISKIGKYKNLIKCFFIILFFLSISLNLFHYLKWNKNKTSKIKDISLELKDNITNGYIAGLTAPAVVLENNHKSLFLYPNFVNFKDTFKKYNLTHAILGTGLSNEISIYYQKWPVRMQNSILINVYNLKNYHLHLYSFIDPFIKSVTINDRDEFELLIYNPDKNNRTININVLTASNFNKTNISEYIAKPGKNIFYLKFNSFINNKSSLLFYIDKLKYKEKFRYEAESFRERVGINKTSNKHSNNMFKFFDTSKDKPGFLGYSHQIYYSPGIIRANYAMAFSKVKSNFKKISSIDIYSHNSRNIACKRDIRKINIKNKDSFAMVRPIFKTDKIEYRVKALGNGNIEFDYVEIEYIQGHFFNWTNSKKVGKNEKFN